jgi:hypothetical protein
MESVELVTAHPGTEHDSATDDAINGLYDEEQV